MLNVQFDAEQLRSVLREEMKAIVEETVQENAVIVEGKMYRIQELPAVMTRSQLKDFLNLKDTKVAQLLARPDFPVCREAGVLIPTHLLIEWLEKNTQGVHNARKLKAM